MADRALRFCGHAGCGNLTTGKYCEEHKGDAVLQARAQDERRGSSAERGYNWKWHKYSAAFLRRPENKICKLHLEGCTIVAECVDHIDPPDGPSDPRFWDKHNHQAACLHCNSVKGHRKIKGTFEL